MSNDDLKLPFSRHATSKLSTVEDLSKIATLGFRGRFTEIASVSRLQKKSSIDDKSGNILEIEAGQIKNNEKIACNKGTEIKVKNLFYNTPARKKFLKTSSQELRKITKIVKRFLLSNPNVSFKYLSDDKNIYDFMATSLDKRIIQTFGSKYSNDILEVKNDKDNFKIFGYVGSLVTSKEEGVVGTFF